MLTQFPKYLIKRKNQGIFTIGLILITCSIIGVFSFYPSPYVYNSYWGVSHAEFQGATWFAENANPTINVVGLGTSDLFRYTAALWGQQNATFQNTSEIVPLHFNYTTHTMLSESFSGNRYLLLRESYIISLYHDVYPQLARFSTDDFAKLNIDLSVNKFFENGEIELWYVKD
jgi:hypothetical protein